MPEGSSSAAPVTSPGPSDRSTFLIAAVLGVACLESAMGSALCVKKQTSRMFEACFKAVRAKKFRAGELVAAPGYLASAISGKSPRRRSRAFSTGHVNRRNDPYGFG